MNLEPWILDKKTIKREYLETPRPAGVFQIRNSLNGKVFVGTSTNLDGILNRCEFQLRAGGHPVKTMQADWNAQNGEGFEFSVLEELVERENLDQKKELAFLEELWIENLDCLEPNGYNERKKSREERLKMIAAKNADAGFRK